MKVLIVSGGKSPDKKLLLDEIKSSDLYIAADRGCESFFRENINPHWAVGDFDSLDDEFKERLKNTKLEVFNSEKDNTDSEIAVLKAIELGATEIVLLGVTGTRIDHMMANLGLLNICLEKKIKCCIKDKNNIIYLVNKPTLLYGKSGQYISFQAYGQEVKNFYISGAKYELEGYTLTFGDCRCVSNEFKDGPIKIGFNQGKVLVIYSKD